MEMDRVAKHYQSRLSSANPEVRLLALKALMEINQPPALDRLTEMLQTDPDMRVRMGAVEVLSLCYREKALEALSAAARLDASARVRMTAVSHIVLIGDASAVPVLMDRLEHDPDRQVQQKAYGYLLLDPDASPEPLLKRIEKGESEALYALVVAAKVHSRMDLIEAAIRANPTLVVREAIAERGTPAFGPVITMHIEAELMRQGRDDLAKALRGAFHRDHSNELER